MLNKSICLPIHYPIIMQMPIDNQSIEIKQRTANLRRFARETIFLSAAKSNIHLIYLIKNMHGAPIPIKGVYWSLSHSHQMVCGIVSNSKVGIDIELIRPISLSLYNKIGNPEEWKICGGQSKLMFYRIWTSKEAVLKAEGVGIIDLDKCFVDSIIDDTHLIIQYKSLLWRIQHYYIDDYICSVVQNERDLHWMIL